MGRSTFAVIGALVLGACSPRPQADHQPMEEPPVEEKPEMTPPADPPPTGTPDGETTAVPAPPEVDAQPSEQKYACTTDSDCSVTTLGDDCCTRCASRAFNAAWLSQYEQECNVDAAVRSCPLLRCAEPSDEVARCVAGSCEAVAPTD